MKNIEAEMVVDCAKCMSMFFLLDLRGNLLIAR